ncbi:MAG: 2-amino-4-hydroxy-6-hydroxymethyldihydropteridine diphosphokinase [Clostridiaceae bacterium]|nr:2-amino-4-hydroxy-6-hydroxymethyldihydropteridine diphosphokinase [Clostridiaceae bacterium]
MAKAYLGLGSNMGDKKKYLDDAMDFIEEHGGIKVNKVSSYYETEPVGYEEQDLFLNIVAEIDTTLEPYDLLAYCNTIEERLNRKRIIRWGPRTIDVDILLYENYTSVDDTLTIPHPRMLERNFVMVPLYEIADHIIIDGTKIHDIINELNKNGIRKVSHE